MAQDALSTGFNPALVEPRSSRMAGVWRFARRNPIAAASACLLVVMVLVALTAPWIAPYGYQEYDLDARLQGPSTSHFLGTDRLGRDVFSRMLYGARVSLGVGFGAVALAIIIGTVFGLLSGYIGGLVDLIVQRVVDVVIAFPALIIAISVLAVFGGGMVTLALVLGGLLTTGVTRIVRGNVLIIRNNMYIEAAQAMGATQARIMIRHVLPNVAPTIIVIASVYVGSAILSEASLSFLGFGVPPPYPSWGSMLNTSARVEMLKSPMLSVWPGVAIMMVVFSFNMFGDALRDILDPRLRGVR